jgi:hypothetical protein
VIVALPPGWIVANAHVTVTPSAVGGSSHEPCGEENVATAEPNPNGSRTTTFSAALGPLFRTVAVKVTPLPYLAGLGAAVIATEMSAVGTAVAGGGGVGDGGGGGGGEVGGGGGGATGGGGGGGATGGGGGGLTGGGGGGGGDVGGGGGGGGAGDGGGGGVTGFETIPGTTVVTTVAELLLPYGSGEVATTVATFTTFPTAVGWTVRVTVACPPGISVPIVHVKSLPPVHEPWLD